MVLPARIVADDGTSYVAYVHRRGSFASLTKWLVIAVCGLAMFLLGVRFGSDGTYTEGVDSLERLFIGRVEAEQSTGLFGSLRRLDGTHDAVLSRAETAARIESVQLQCAESRQAAEQAWTDYFLGLQTIIKVEVGRIQAATANQVAGFKAVEASATGAEQQCSHVRALLDAILLQVTNPPTTSLQTN